MSVGIEILKFLLVVQGAVVLALLLCWRFDMRAASRERRELYDRIQAGTLADYAAQKAVLEAEPALKRQEIDMPAPRAYVGESGGIEEEESFIDARSAFVKLVDGGEG